MTMMEFPAAAAAAAAPGELALPTFAAVDVGDGGGDGGDDFAQNADDGGGAGMDDGAGDGSAHASKSRLADGRPPNGEVEYTLGGVPLVYGPGPAQRSGERFRSIVCVHWLSNACMKGDDCDFLHEFDVDRMPDCPKGRTAESPTVRSGTFQTRSEQSATAIGWAFVRLDRAASTSTNACPFRSSPRKRTGFSRPASRQGTAGTRRAASRTETAAAEGHTSMRTQTRGVVAAAAQESVEAADPRLQALAPALEGARTP